jgi:hypothetical protein
MNNWLPAVPWCICRETNPGCDFMNSACFLKWARNDSDLSFGTTKVLARTMARSSP